MKILHTADWHLGRSKNGVSWLADQVATLNEIAKIVEEQQVDVVLLAGDVFHGASTKKETYLCPAKK